MNNDKVTGIIPPMLTPLNRDGSISKTALRTLVNKLIDGRAAGIFVGGTAGLGAQLTQGQYISLVECALEIAGGRAPVFAGVLEPSTSRAVERIRILEKIGCRNIVLTSTYYLPPRSQEEFLVHFGNCVEAAGRSMTAYNIPFCTGIDIEISTMEKMIKKGWLHMVKDSSGNAEYFSELCALGKSSGVGVFQGLYPDMRRLVELGASGCVPVPGNVCPELFANAWATALARDWPRLEHMQRRIDKVWSALVAGNDFFSGSLYALARQNVLEEIVPPPFSLMPATRKDAVDALLAE